ncbi:MAG: hypothetical protein NZ957_03800 [Thaumarchaeota archaeon]|nr:hypothetical protein [Candidatus Calditenuaceae archaeon]
MPVEAKLRVRGFRSKSTRPKEIEEMVELSRRTRAELKEKLSKSRETLDELREEMSRVKGQMETLRRAHKEDLREVRMKAF